MNIDWSKAPEGATHWGSSAKCKIGNWIEGFYRYHEQERCWQHFYSGRWRDGMEDHEDWPERLASLTQRPQSWSGEGLPPVGTVCEVDYCEEWRQCEVIAHFQQRCGMVAAFTVECLDGAKSLDAYGAEYFRPIRTPEQIAAEEREKAVSEMAIIALAGDNDLINKAWLDRLYDAGYRKQVTP